MQSQPFVRSTTHRFGRTTKPRKSSVRLTTSTISPVSSCRESITSPRYAPSAHIRSSVGYSLCASRRTGTAPSRSCVDAGVITTVRMSPRTSTRRCRFRPFTFFSRVEAFRATDVSALHTLAIYNRGCRFRLLPCRCAYKPSELVMNGIQHSILCPPLVALEDGGPRRKVMREQPPRSARTRTIPNRVHELPRVVLRLLKICYPYGRRNHVSDERPFLIGQVGGVAEARWAFLESHAA